MRCVFEASPPYRSIVTCNHGVWSFVTILIRVPFSSHFRMCGSQAVIGSSRKTTTYGTSHPPYGPRSDLSPPLMKRVLETDPPSIIARSSNYQIWGYATISHCVPLCGHVRVDQCQTISNRKFLVCTERTCGLASVIPGTDQLTPLMIIGHAAFPEYHLLRTRKEVLRSRVSVFLVIPLRCDIGPYDSKVVS